MTMTMRRATIATLALGALLLPATGAAAETQFLLEGHRQVRINDQLAKDAKLYASPAGSMPQLVVVAAELPKPVLLSASDRTATTLDPSQLNATPGTDMIELADAGAPGAKAPLTVDGIKLRFVLENRRVVVEPRDPLVGEVAPDQALAYMPEYRRGAAAYVARRGDERLLETVQKPTEIDVFFGSWCPHCEHFVPRLLRVIEDVKNPNLKFRFHGLPNAFAEDPVARQWKITAVPVAVVRRGSDEIGRVEGDEWEHPETGLTAVLFGDGQ